MSFDARDKSVANGAPIKLYRFRRGVLSWAYTGADRHMEFNDELFRTVPGGINDDGIRRTGETNADRLKITGPANLDVAMLYRSFPPSVEIELTVYEHHLGDTEAKAVWNGTIESVSWPSLDRCVISAQPYTSTLDVPGLRLTWGRNCGAALFDRRCKVNRELFRVDISIQSLDGSAISSEIVSGYAAGWFDGGFAEWTVGVGEADRRAIERQAGAVLTLMGGTAGLVVGQALRIFPGCNRTAAMCHSKFNNLLNMRADPNMMGKNIFNGNPVF